MYAKFAIRALLASNLANAAVLPRGADEFATSLTVSEDASGALIAPAAATTNPVNGLPVPGPQPHSAASGAPSAKKSGKGSKKLQQGFIGAGNPGHGQKPQPAAAKPKQPKSGELGQGTAKKAKSDARKPKAPQQGGKAAAGGSPEPFATTPPAAAPTAAPAPAPSSSSVAAPAPSSAPAPKASKAPNGSSGGSGGSFTGDLTYYTPGLGSCGVTNTESDMIVALAANVMTGSANPNANPNCGKSITITYNGVSAQATIEDTCPGCSGGGLDLTPTLFQKFAPLGEGRLTGATWHFN